MNTSKLFYGLLTFLVLFIAACTDNTADDQTYEFGVDRSKVVKEQSVDRGKVVKEQSVDRTKVVKEQS